MQKQMCLFLLLAICLFNCNHENDVAPKQGKVTFSLSKTASRNGRTKGNISPEFVMLSVVDSNNNMQENIKLPLFHFGENYVSENLELQTGNYQLTKFLVLNSDNEIVYATPVQGSVLASYVNTPLPLEFVITEEGTQVVPEVIGVSENDNPEIFGYTNFGFNVINITALEIPDLDEEQIMRVSYEFSNGSKTIVAEVNSPKSIVDLNNPELLGKAWKTRIMLWTESDCYPKVYRYTGTLTFNGAPVKLPSFNNETWKIFFYTEVSGVKMFFPENPNKFSFMIDLSGLGSVHGYVDRGHWDEAGEMLCELKFSEIVGNGIIELNIEDQPECDVTASYSIDSFLSITTSTLGLVETYFNWEVNENGDFEPVCSRISFNGKNIGNHPRSFRTHFTKED